VRNTSRYQSPINGAFETNVSFIPSRKRLGYRKVTSEPGDSNWLATESKLLNSQSANVWIILRVDMPKKSAGLLLFRRNSDAQLEVLLVHPGGPFWRNKDEGGWTVPKGEFADDEDALAAARREFKEETGSDSPVGDYVPLQPIKQAGGKIVHAWAIEADFDPAGLQSNTFLTEWPPRSGRMQEFPEVDRAEWFTEDAAKRKILSGQLPLIDQLIAMVRTPPAGLHLHPIDSV